MPARIASSERGVQSWIQRATQRHLALLDKVRDKLEASLEEHQETDGNGKLVYIPADLTPAGTPNRDWCRAFGRYQAGFLGIVGAEQERVRLQLLARRAGMDVMSDEDYERELIELGREAVGALSDEEIAAEARRRGLALGSGDSNDHR